MTQKQPNGMADGFDAHCHIFNLKYLLKEAKCMLFHWIHGEYPVAPEEASKSKSKEEKEAHAKGKIKELLIQIWETGSACLTSEKHNYLFIREEAHKAWKLENFGAFPLMMDIYYIFATPVTDGAKKASEKRAASTTSFNETNFEKHYAELVDQLKAHVHNQNYDLSFLNDLEEHFTEAKNDKAYQKHLSGNEKRIDNDLFLSSGFEHHMNELIELVENNDYPVYPFFAVDPRRPGIIDAIKSDKYISKNGPFYGVKLYPRLGYDPQSEEVKEILRICKKRDLPVVVHCGQSGFPPGIDWKYAQFGNPYNFEDSLKELDGLRINFAHMGSCSPEHAWAYNTVDLMKKYNGVYSDLSCYTDQKEIEEIKNPLWKTGDNNLDDRLMYGSDFDVMYFTDKVTMKKYYENFSAQFTEDELNKMRFELPKEFLSGSKN